MKLSDLERIVDAATPSMGWSTHKHFLAMQAVWTHSKALIAVARAATCEWRHHDDCRERCQTCKALRDLEAIDG